MDTIFAGESDFYEGSMHVRVISGAEVDAELMPYAETELSDAELLALAAEDATEALEQGKFGCANTTLDELELRRAMRRTERRAIRSSQRMALGVIA